MTTETTNLPNLTWLWRGVIPIILIAGGLWFISKPARTIEQPAAAIEQAEAAVDAETSVAEVAAVEVSTVDLDPAPKIGHPAPDFTLVNLEGQAVSLSDFRGQPVILNFWATWCGPCRLEMPHLQASYAAHEDEDLVILGVNLTKDDDPNAIPAFIDEFALTFPIILDEDGEMRKLYQLFGQPASVFIDRDGVITEFWQGPINEAFIEERLAKIL